jgi:hypothetical protein
MSLVLAYQNPEAPHLSHLARELGLPVGAIRESPYLEFPVKLLVESNLRSYHMSNSDQNKDQNIIKVDAATLTAIVVALLLLPLLLTGFIAQ